MTTITAEAVFEQAMQLPPTERVRLKAMIDEQTPLYLQMLPEIQQLLKGVIVADLVVEPQVRRDEALSWLRDVREGKFVDEAAEAEGEGWEEVLRNIDLARNSARLLFPHLHELTHIADTAPAEGKDKAACVVLYCWMPDHLVCWRTQRKSQCLCAMDGRPAGKWRFCSCLRDSRLRGATRTRPQR